MLGYIGKYGIYYFLINLFQKKNNSKNNYIISDINFNNNETNNNNTSTINNSITDDIFSNNTFANQTNFTYFLQMNINEKYIYLIIIVIYALSIIISIIFYQIFKCVVFIKKEKINNFKCFDFCCIWKTFFVIFNCIFYIESIEVKSKNKNCCILCGETIRNYCDIGCCSIINLFYYEKNTCKCCCCCCEYNEEHYDKSTQCFCFCYQEKSFCSWIDKFFTNELQEEVIPCMKFYLLARLASIGSEQQLKQNYINQSKFIIMFIIGFFIFCIFSVLMRFTKKNISKMKTFKGNKIINFSNDFTADPRITACEMSRILFSAHKDLLYM